MTGPDEESAPADPVDALPPSRRARRAARREERWTRTPAPKDWRYWVGGVGRVFIVTGLLMFGFVAYQLWGTGIEYARAQNELDDEFDQLLASASSVTVPATTTTTTTTTTTPTTTEPDLGEPASTQPASSTTATPTTTTTTVPITVPITVPVPDFQDGSVLARIEIPTIGVDTKVVSGVAPGDLKKGPGHYRDTPMPGQLGNSAIAGHRTTFGQPFFRLDELEAGDEIVVTTIQGRFVYLVDSKEVVGPGDSEVIATTDPTSAKLTLTTCDPKYTARNRLIVYADLDVDASGPGLPPVVRPSEDPPVTLPGEPVDSTATTSASGTASTFPGDDPTVSSPTTDAAPDTTAPATTVPPVLDGGDGEDAADAFSHGWFSDGAAWPQVFLWGLVTALVAVGGWLVARSLRRYWAGALAALVPFVVTLYFFYQNVNRLLPAAL